MIAALLPWWAWILTVVVLILGAARLTRLLTHDSFPPIVKARIWYEDRVPEAWGPLVRCHWCMGPWQTLIAIVWLTVSLIWVPWLFVAWAFFYGWMALSYLVSQYVHFDEGPPEE